VREPPPAPQGTAPGAPDGTAAGAGEPTAPGAGPQGSAPRHSVPRWLFPLGLLVALEPPILIVLWAVDHDLAGGDLLAIALVGGLFISLPSLAILGLAMIWDRRLSGGETVPGLPEAMTGPTASRVAAVALVVSTLLLGGLLALLMGAWALVALPPLALSLASAWLMSRNA
jgi:hypothetical protein